MAKVIGYSADVYKRFTCKECAAIVQYAPNEAKETGGKDDGTFIKGLPCPECGAFYRTNP